MKSEITSRSVKDLVIEEAALAHLFERYEIDYCCHGDEPLGIVCERKGLEIEVVLREMENAKSARPHSFLHCELWDVEFLIDYIVENHHRFCKETIPVLRSQVTTLAAEHGDSFSYIKPVMLLFQRGAHDMEQHMRKEEMILFPYIKSLASAVEFGRRKPMAPFSTLSGPISSMQEEHLEVTAILGKIRALLSGYRIPTEACPLHRSVITGLQAFSKDMHQHVHLENNILFPRTLAMESSFDARTGQPLAKLPVLNGANSTFFY